MIDLYSVEIWGYYLKNNRWTKYVKGVGGSFWHYGGF